MAHVHSCRGGFKGHVFRRIFHVLTFTFVPIIYSRYTHLQVFSFRLKMDALMFFVLGLVMILEFIRIKCRCVVFAMRDYEENQLSALAWGAISLVLALSLSPSSAIAYALCFSAAVVDPMVGEMKRKRPLHVVYTAASAVSLLVWGLSAFYFGFSYWLALICGLLTVLAEYPQIPYLDDNFLMIVIPLVFVLASPGLGF